MFVKPSLCWDRCERPLLAHGGPSAKLVCLLNARSGKSWHHYVTLNAAQASQLASFCRPGKAQPPPGKNTAQERPNSVAGIRRHASLSGILPSGAMLSRFRVKLPGVARMTEESPPLASAASCRLGPGDHSLNVASAADPEHRS